MEIQNKLISEKYYCNVFFLEKLNLPGRAPWLCKATRPLLLPAIQFDSFTMPKNSYHFRINCENVEKELTRRTNSNIRWHLMSKGFIIQQAAPKYFKSRKCLETLVLNSNFWFGIH